MPLTSPLTGTIHVDRSQVLVRALSVGLLTCALIAVPFLIHYRTECQRLLDNVFVREHHFVELISRIITHTVQSVVSDLRYLSNQRELRDLLNDDTESRRSNLADEYAAFLAQKPRYDQVRWIGPDGRERVRVYRADDGVAVAGPDALQDKAHRYYFAATMRLGAGEIYVSPLDLNVEHDRVEEPRKPTLRVAVPLFDAAGGRAGMLVVNYLAGPLLAELRALAVPDGNEPWLLNAEGHWLLGPDPDAEWGFMYPDRGDRSLAVRDPAAWRTLSQDARGRLDRPEGVLTFERLYPLLAADRTGPAGSALSMPTSPSDYFWIVATHVPRARLQSEAAELARDLLVAYAALATLSFAVASGLALLSFRARALGRFVRDVLDRIPTLIAYVDARERYRFNNRAYETLFGLTRAQIAGRTIRSVIGEQAYATTLPHIRTALAGHEASFEGRLAYAGGIQRDVSVTYVPDLSRDAVVHGFLVIVNDVTALKAAERRERQRLQEAAHATRLASVGELATQLAHEVNQPITAMITYCAAAQRNIQSAAPAGSRLHDLIGAIADEAQRVSNIVRRLRDFVRKGEIAFVAVDVNEVVRDSLHLVAGEAASQGVEIVQQLATAPLRVMGDSVLVGQATLNLLRNAIDAAAAGTGPQRVVTVTTRPSDRSVEVSVTDNGPGLAPQVAARLFEAFVTTKPNGLGMGLSIARSLIEAHGGQISHSDAPGGGCTFSFTLPGVDA